jgi:hypothetical protein
MHDDGGVGVILLDSASNGGELGRQPSHAPRRSVLLVSVMSG